METVRRSLHAGGLIVTVGLLSWASGYPALFPSLGPTAYVLALGSEKDANVLRVVGGHVLGVLAGLLAYHALATGLVATDPAPAFSRSGLRIATAGVVSVGLTTWAMLATGLRHAPACATTLIVSLGLLSTAFEGAVIVGSVVVLVGAEQLLLWADRRFDRGI
jgi:hypothetical protein